MKQYIKYKTKQYIKYKYNYNVNIVLISQKVSCTTYKRNITQKINNQNIFI